MTTITYTDKQAARIAAALAALEAAIESVRPPSTNCLGAEHAAYKAACREYTAALADAGDELALAL